MPTYDLSCRACGSRFEKFLQRIIRDEDKVCPECGSHDVKTGFGGGFLGSGTGASASSGSAPQAECTPVG